MSSYLCCFQRWSARSHDVVPDVPNVPAFKEQLSQAPPVARLQIQKTENALLHATLRQDSYMLAFDGIPAKNDTNELEKDITHLTGFVSHNFTLVEDKLNLVVNFATVEDATMALATYPSIDLGNGTQSVGRHVEFEDDMEGPVRKRTKLEEAKPPLPRCCICNDELANEFSKPCFYCKSAWCHDCLVSQFTVALSDPERFPAKCCSRVLHFDVVRDILSPENYVKYRERFEQHNTTKPVYCAMPSCSAFLPPRIAKPNLKGEINCPECQNITCTRCRVLIDLQVKHECTLADETTALLVKFGYKSCPRCNAGVAKMFGCPHVRCQCGAHWCWDCQRPIQICWQKPCEANRDNGEYYDEESVMSSEDESEATTEPTPQTNEFTPGAAVPSEEASGTTEDVLVTENPTSVQETNTPEDFTPAVATLEPTPVEQIPLAATMTPAAPAVEESVENLDDEDADEWENGDYDFGDEPIDESWDTWGCMHRIVPVINKNVWCAHRDWMPNTIDSGKQSKRVDCQKCCKTVILIDSEPDVTDRHERKDSGCDVTTVVEPQRDTESAEATIASVREAKKKRKAKKKNERPELYNCAKCGIFYCLACNKASIKDIHNLKHSIR